MKPLLHGGWRVRVSLLASGALVGEERLAVLEHLTGCPACRDARVRLGALLDTVASDPVRTAQPPISAAALLARVEARLDAAAAPRRSFRIGWAALPAAAAVLLALLGRPHAVDPPAPRVMEVREDAMRRLEASLARDQAVRYLTEAQDVLLNVAAHPQDCDKGEGRVDVGDEARRSRQLLARRALVETDREAVASAREVLEDVEQVLREVAALESCARAADLTAIHRDLEARKLLMKIDLMTRELAG